MLVGFLEMTVGQSTGGPKQVTGGQLRAVICSLEQFRVWALQN